MPAEVVSRRAASPEITPETGPQLIVLVGPTASGKSALGLELAQRLGGEVVNADAMALYRGMEIGTARTPVNQRFGIVHHQIDVLDVTQEASVAAYQRHARADIEAVTARGNWPLLVGGSGLYVRAVADQIEFPGTDPNLRAQWEALGVEHGPGYLHAELERRDPAAAQSINPANLRRLVRALEVVELTGQPFQAQLRDLPPWRPTVRLGLHLETAELDQRIEQRTADMMRAGLIEETRTLAEVGLRVGRTASRAIGYREALQVLDGQINATEAQERIALATRQLARRQMKWFRRDQHLTWLSANSPDLVEQAWQLINQGS
ncbi:MAG: tRNA (adenosine(37)-N6)-dimethylallyltransferase MiaA [Bifidobacteriaceae bacterium]|jgi:tRNA dimethylallyltransferase|nr:tRNA (adenosine(37)-N6)-dimethylallyltransferase MiaA [Bifidobacteriaceae bacterium]